MEAQQMRDTCQLFIHPKAASSLLLSALVCAIVTATCCFVPPVQPHAALAMRVVLLSQASGATIRSTQTLS